MKFRENQFIESAQGNLFRIEKVNGDSLYLVNELTDEKIIEDDIEGKIKSGWMVLDLDRAAQKFDELAAAQIVNLYTRMKIPENVIKVQEFVNRRKYPAGMGSANGNTFTYLDF